MKEERDIFALEAMKIFILHQGTKTMPLMSKIRLWLGSSHWKQTIKYNFEDIAQKSYVMADCMLEQKNLK